MSKKIKGIYTIVFIWRVLLCIIITILGGKERRELIYSDLLRIKDNNIPFDRCNIMRMAYVLLTQQQFRSIFYYRYKRSFLAFVSKLTLPANNDIEISCKNGNIGGGILLYHKMGRVIDVFSCGENVTISQGVTIGLGSSNDEGRKSPIIGNNCTFATNCVVFGPIEIGDNVIVGASALVNKDVPSNCIVVGNPPYIPERDGVRVNEKL